MTQPQPINKPLNNNQIFHSPSKASHPFWGNPDAISTVIQSFSGARLFTLDRDILRFAARMSKLDGLWLELGVASGRTIRFLAENFPQQVIYGFDSFQGLAEDWIRGDSKIPKGTFYQETLPKVPKNVRLIQGWFRDTLPAFAAEYREKIAFLHVDCDLYSSTIESLEFLSQYIVPGTVILFDEFYNYPGCENHEVKAFQEFIEGRPLSYCVLAFNAMHEQVVIEITPAYL
jgi:hypothetical protein